MSAREELRSFLKSRRASIEPDQVGLMGSSSRRVAGLRREEVAVRANVSVDYYTQLEQGRPITPSPVVLAAISDALMLDDAQRDYFRRLTSEAGAVRVSASTPVRGGLLTLLGGMRNQGAFIVDQRMQVLAANRIADALMGGWIAAGRHDGNLAKYVFQDESARSAHPDWDHVSSSMVATLRYGAARWSDDVVLATLVTELARTPDFADIWDRHEVEANMSGSKRFRLDEETLEVDYEVLVLPGDADARLTIYSAQRGSSAAAFFSQVDDAWSREASEADPWVVLITPPSGGTF